MQRVLNIARQLMIGLFALQMLNLSLCSPDIAGMDYDYSYTYNKSYDPTESAVEWIVETECGQQKAFSYNNHSDNGKNLLKTFHWHTVICETEIKMSIPSAGRMKYPEIKGRSLISRHQDPLSPPPRA